MSVAVLQAYGSCRINELMPPLASAFDWDISATVDRVRQVIGEYNMASIVGVTRTHKHLEILTDEKLITTTEFSKDGVGRIVVRFRVPTTDEENFLIPYQFIYDTAAHSWMPVAYWDSRALGGENAFSALKSLLEKPAFLTDVANVLSKCPGNLHGATTGLTLRYHEFVPGFRGCKLRESTYEDERMQCFDRVSADDTMKAVDTHWFWNQVGVVMLDCWAMDCGDSAHCHG